MGTEHPRGAKKALAFSPVFYIIIETPAQADFAAAADVAALENAKARYLGKTGQITEQMKSLGKLPPEDRKVFDDAAKRSAEDVWKMASDVEKKAIEEIKKGGGKIVTPNAEFKAALKKAGEGTWKLFYDTVPNAKEILESVKQYK